MPRVARIALAVSLSPLIALFVAVMLVFRLARGPAHASSHGCTRCAKRLRA